jgi:acid phosphatase (class A)
MKQVDADGKYFVSEAKTHFDRKRPYIEDERIHPAVEKEETPAYPSGHATRAIVYSRILAQIAPEHKKELVARGLEIGWDRVVGGVHHPSDIYAGRTIGLALYHAFARSPFFKEQLAEAKAELESVTQQHSAHATAAGSK